MIFTPPRHGKSMTVGRLFPAWFLGRHPDQRVLLISYAAAIVVRHSRFVRNLIRTPRFQGLFPEVAVARDSSSVGSWDIAGRMGGLDAMGIQGSVTGRGAHLLVIDDPVKNQQQAESPDHQEAIWDSLPQRSLHPPGTARGRRADHDPLGRGRSGRAAAASGAGRLAGAAPAQRWRKRRRLPKRGIDPLGRAAGKRCVRRATRQKNWRASARLIGARAFAASTSSGPFPRRGCCSRRRGSSRSGW
ncbi:MAG: hypothetical protein IPK19_20755 [Chloroflexi bacterium]|nr:hypothetical protein [Chloroflexota bacterium]